MDTIIKQIALDLGIKESQVEKTLSLMGEGNTVPFIARYRKEMTGGLDEDQIRIIHENFTYQENLAKRKEDVLRLIEQQGKLSDEIIKAVEDAKKLAEVDDIYRPYQQKRKTRATDAVAKGLQPLADWMIACPTSGELAVEAAKYLSDNVESVEDAIQGAKDIVAEYVSDDAAIRSRIRGSMERYGLIESKIKKNAVDERKVYSMYYEYSEKLSTLASHRIMALDRAEKEKVLSVNIVFDEEYLEQWVIRRVIKKNGCVCASELKDAIHDGLKRLAYPSVEREIRSELSDKAHEQSIDIFSLNVEKLLLQAPMKDQVILGFDPAFRTGCKLAIIDATGKVLHIDVIYPHQPKPDVVGSKKKLSELVRKYNVSIIAIGNGTASRESEAFVANLIKEEKLNTSYTIVSEAGASVYSASNLAKAEFPNLQVEQRSAISIARRIMDPLAELIKIDPQSIGVGQYQHDLPTARLKERLDFAVSKVVNRVGVNINTASKELLQNISGLTSASAGSIVSYREENGAVVTRAQIKKIPKIGAKTFEQAAGFLRIEDGTEWLDRTSIHPENYKLAKAVLKKLKIDETMVGSEEAKAMIERLSPELYANEFESDVYTMKDIFEAVVTPLRDYRDDYASPMLKSDVLELSDLHVAQELQGVVRNVVDFGAFVDIGLHEDGLVHISKMSKQRVKHPSDVVSVGDIVKVWVLAIDEEKGRVQLSLLPISA